MLKVISSRDNNIIKKARSLSTKRGRTKNGLYLAEGKRLVSDAFGCIPNQIEGIIATSDFKDKNKDFIKSLDNDGKIVYITDERIFKELSMTETPQGVAALIKIPKEEENDLNKVNDLDYINAFIDEVKDMSYILILDGISEPGNMGTIIRTAEAAGIQCIMLKEGCTDIYSPKTVRAAMGSVFRMKFKKMWDTDANLLKKAGFTLAATALYDSVPMEEAKFSGKRAIIIGSEANGVSEEMLKLSDIRIRIDMKGSVESLNAAVAAGIAMYALRPLEMTL